MSGVDCHAPKTISTGVIHSTELALPIGSAIPIESEHLTDAEIRIQPTYTRIDSSGGASMTPERNTIVGGIRVA